MNKYKVEFIETVKYIVDVEAKDEQEATDKANIKFQELDVDMVHYNETDRDTVMGNVYDVTNTDDPFNP